ncbi:MAG TPA: hypothetical protein VGD67_27925 [Pseudonocardiaceae bacterium]
MSGWFGRHRVAAGVAALVVVVLAGAGYVAWTVAARPDAPPATAAAPGGGGLVFIDQRGGGSTVTRRAPDGTTTATGLRCQRVYQAGGTTLCLRLAGIGPRYEAAVLDAAGTELRVVPLPGTPSRARVSADGRLVNWTVFVTGDSYLIPGQFATRTGILDLRDGSLQESLEHYALTIDGRPYARADVNYWGVTFTEDNRAFYATVGSGGRTWLVRGDPVARTATGVRENAECPSLSPDNTRVAYKKRSGRLGAWQVHVLDLATGVETPIPGTSTVDDQVAWLDDATLAYAKSAGDGAPPTIYTSRADGTGEPVALVSEASSPAPLPEG